VTPSERESLLRLFKKNPILLQDKFGVKGILYEAVKTVVENHYQDVSVNEQIEIMAGILADLEGLIQEVTMSTKALN